MSDIAAKPGQSGFEFQNRFVELTSSDVGKDLMLIDRITGMGIDEFNTHLSDDDIRGSVMLALIATSIRAAFPDWSVERIYREVTNMRIGELTFIGKDAGDDAVPPPSENDNEPEAAKPDSES